MMLQLTAVDANNMAAKYASDMVAYHPGRWNALYGVGLAFFGYEVRPATADLSRRPDLLMAPKPTPGEEVQYPYPSYIVRQGERA